MNERACGNVPGDVGPHINLGVNDETSGASAPQTSRSSEDLMQTLALGEQLIASLASAFNLAGLEARLAMQTLPKLILIWLLMAPIILLVWCSFCGLVAWVVFALSGQLGLSFFAFFVLQVVLLLICRWLYGLYCNRMTLPHTRSHINDLISGVENEFSRRR